MAAVFVSYASEDRPHAERLAHVLMSLGWSVWWDRELVAGDRFDREIERQLDSARAVVVLWSRHAVASDWVLDEATDALERSVLVPIKIDPAKQPLRFRQLNTVSLTGWTGDPTDERVASIDRALRSLAGEPPSTATATGDVPVEPTNQPAGPWRAAKVLSRPHAKIVDRPEELTALGSEPGAHDADHMGPWTALASVVFVLDDVDCRIPSGFITEFDSLPEIVRDRTPPRQWDDRLRWPCYVHAWLYSQPDIERRFADHILLSLMQAEKAEWPKRALLYRAVRLFASPQFDNLQAAGPRFRQ